MYKQLKIKISQLHMQTGPITGRPEAQILAGPVTNACVLMFVPYAPLGFGCWLSNSGCKTLNLNPSPHPPTCVFSLHPTPISSPLPSLEPAGRCSTPYPPTHPRSRVELMPNSRQGMARRPPASPARGHNSNRPRRWHVQPQQLPPPTACWVLPPPPQWHDHHPLPPRHLPDIGLRADFGFHRPGGEAGTCMFINKSYIYKCL